MTTVRAVGEARSEEPPRRAVLRVPSSPTGRTIALALVLAVGSGLWFPHVTGGSPLHRGVPLPWWVLVLAFATTESFVFHLEMNREAHSFTLSELPLAIGLFFASPLQLVLGRLLGEMFILVVRARQPALKVAFNLCSFLTETLVAIAVFRAVSGGASVLSVRSWLAAFAAVGAADAVGIVLVTAVILWHGGRTQPAQVVLAGGVTYIANTALALVTVIQVSVAPAASALLVLLAAILWAAYRGYARLTQRYSSLQMLYDFTRMVGDSVRAEAVMEAMLSQAGRLLRATTAEIAFVEDGTIGLRWRLDEDGVLMRPADVSPEADAVLTAVMALERPLLVPRGSKIPDVQRRAERLGVRDCVIAPLRSQKHVFGVIMAANRLGDVSTFDHADLKLFETLANHAAVALENGRLMDQLRQEAAERRHEALHDALTGLPNRAMFRQRVADELSRRSAGRTPLAVMLMDLDRFKDVNDTLGHHNGDFLLQQVSSRLESLQPPGATIARLGGDEFAVLVPAVRDRREARQLAEAFHAALLQPITIEELTLEVRASIGIALWPEHGGDVTTLLKRADIAMYAAKTRQAGVTVYETDLDNNSPRRLSLAAELNHAIEAGELVVFYQPKARLSDGEIVGVEALVRWEHPVHGFVSPDEFIPLAETTGVIRALTSHVLRTAVRDCASWHDMGLDLHVAVNLAARSLHDSTLAAEVAGVLREFGVEPSALTLEITESSVMSDMNRSTRVLDDLAAIGVELSIDDFGTGYSSLSYLQRLPVHEIKVDRSFVFALATSAEDATIVRSVVELGHNLDLRVVAEGVEHGPVWERLADMGCDVAQGYYLSRPVPEPQLREFLLARASRAPIRPSPR